MRKSVYYFSKMQIGNDFFFTATKLALSFVIFLRYRTLLLLYFAITGFDGFSSVGLRTLRSRYYPLVLYDNIGGFIAR
ncbi:hypothetical protein D3C71_843810 [compost metagenome]